MVDPESNNEQEHLKEIVHKIQELKKTIGSLAKRRELICRKIQEIDQNGDLNPRSKTIALIEVAQMSLDMLSEYEACLQEIDQLLIQIGTGNGELLTELTTLQLAIIENVKKIKQWQTSLDEPLRKAHDVITGLDLSDLDGYSH